MRAWLGALATLGLRRRRLVLVVAGVSLALSLAVVFGTPLEVSTSRRGLIAESVPHQGRLMRFFERFGRPDTLLLLLRGGAPEQRRRAVDALHARLEAMPELDGRVLSLIGPRQVAELMALQEPALLDALGELGPEALRGGLTGWLRALRERLSLGLDEGTGAGEDARGLDAIAQILRGWERELRGRRWGFQDAAPAMPAAGWQLDEHGYLTDAAGRWHFVVMFPDLESDEGAYLAPIVREIRRHRDQVLSDPAVSEVRGELTGVPALAADELRILQQGIRTTSVLTAAFVLLLLWVSFRSLRVGVLALTPLAVGVALTMGCVTLLYGRLNLVTSSFTSVLIGLGIDFGVHLLHRYGEQRRREPDHGALGSAVLLAGPGVATGALTTALAFATLALTDFTAFAELGVITVMGLIIMMVAAFALIPALLPVVVPSRRVEVPRAALVMPVVRWVQRVPRSIVAAAGGVTLLVLVSLVREAPGYDGRYYDFLPERTESYRAMRRVEDVPGMGAAFANFEADSVAAARELAEGLRARSSVGMVQTPSDLFPPLDAAHRARLHDGVRGLEQWPLEAARGAAMPRAERVSPLLIELQDLFDEVGFALQQGGRDPGPARRASEAAVALRRTVSELDEGGATELARLQRDMYGVLSRAVGAAREVVERGSYAPGDIPRLLRGRFVSRDGEALALYAHPAGDIWQADVARAFAREMLALDPGASGLAINLHANERLIIDGFVRAAWLSAVLVLVALLVIFRRLSDALLAMLPVLMGWTWMLGLMSLFDLSFNPANIVALPLLIGIGLDAGAHMVHRSREAKVVRLEDLVSGTGAAVIVASLTTMVGFGALMAADYRAMQSMGLLLSAGIGLSLIASVVVLPAVLRVLNRAR